MKKILAIVLSVAMILSVLVLPSVVTASAESEGKYFVNSFENGVVPNFHGNAEGWASDKWSHEMVSGTARTGTHSLRMFTNGSGWKNHDFYAGTTVENGKTYIVDFYVKFGDASGGNVDFNVVGSDLTDNAWSNRSTLGTNVQLAGWYINGVKDPEWHHFSFKVTPARTQNLWINTCSESSVAELYYDDITVTEVTSDMSVLTVTNARPLSYQDSSAAIYVAGKKGEPVPKLDLGLSTLVCDALYTDNTYATPVTVFPQADATAYVKLADFQGFENGLPAATYATDGYVEGTANSYTGCLSDRYAHTGKYSYEFHTYDAGWKAGHVPVGNVTAGKTYIVDLYYYIDADRSIYGNGHAGAMKIIAATAQSNNYWGANAAQGELLPLQQCWQFVHPTREMGWRHVSLKFTATASNCLFVVFNTDSAICIDAYMDDITLTEVTSDRVVVTFEKEHNMYSNQYSTIQLAGIPGSAISYIPEAEPGQIFEGWYSDAACTTPVTVWPSSAMSLYPGWAQGQDFTTAPALTNNGNKGDIVSVSDGTLKFNAANSDYGHIGGFYLMNNLSTNTAYTIDFDYKVNTACNQVVKVIPVLTSPTNIWGQILPTNFVNHNFEIAANTAAGGWKHGQIAFVTPSSFNGSNSSFVNIQVGAESASSGAMEFDNFVIKQVPASKALVSLNGNGVTLADRYFFADKGTAFSYPAPKGVVSFTGWFSDAACTTPLTTITGNCTAYAGWDGSTQNFENYYTTDISSVFTLNENSEYALSGNNSLHYNGAIAWTNNQAPIAKVTPGKTYVADFWYYAPTAPTYTLCFKFITYGNTHWPQAEAVEYGTLTGSNPMFDNSLNKGCTVPVWNWHKDNIGSWQHAYIKFTAGSTSAYTTVALVVMGMANGTADVYFDDFTFTEVPAGSTAVDFVGSAVLPYDGHYFEIVENGEDVPEIEGLGTYVADNAEFVKWTDADDNEITVIDGSVSVLNANWHYLVEVKGIDTLSEEEDNVFAVEEAYSDDYTDSVINNILAAVPEHEGYDFVGLFMDAEGTVPYENVEVTSGGKAVYAIYEESLVIDDFVEGWNEYNGKTYYMQGGELLTGRQNIDGHLYLFDDNGVQLLGLQNVGPYIAFFLKNDYYDGRAYYGKVYTGGKLYDFTNGPIYHLAGWVTEGGKTYYYVNGEPLTGVQTIGNKTYFFDADGVQSTGFQVVDGKYYYFNSLKYGGTLYKGKVAHGGKVYDTSVNGYAIAPEGWTSDKTSYIENGVKVTGLKKIGKLTYFFDENGNMSTGIKVIDDTIYYFVAKSYGGYAYTGKVSYGGIIYEVSGL